MDDQHELERERKLPGFEHNEDRSVGGGLMSEGGTATDRGTGDLGDGGMPYGTDEDGDESTRDLDDDDQRND